MDNSTNNLQMNLAQKIYFKSMINKLKRRKKVLLKKKTEEAMLKAKISLIEAIKDINLKEDGKSITEKDIKSMDLERTMEAFEEIVRILEETYLNQNENKS